MMLTTDRLILRPWKEEDAEECYRYAKDPLVGPAAGWPVHTSIENSRQIIKEVLSGPETYAIVLKKTGLPIGCIGLDHTDLTKEPDQAELGYWLGVPYWGQGLMPEAGAEVLRHAFEDLGLTKVWCCYYDGNEKSKRVQQKLGFHYQFTRDKTPVPLLGEVRISHVNCMTRGEWMAGAGKDLVYEGTSASALAYAAKGKLEEWIHTYLTKEGHNQAFSDGLKLEKRYYLGPMIMPLSLFVRCCGPEPGMKWQVDEEGFEKRVNELVQRIGEGRDLPPMMVSYQKGRFEVNDGNHRLEAYGRAGVDRAYVIIWITDPEDYKDFCRTYGAYIK